MKDTLKKINENLKERFASDELFHDTEVAANKLGEIILFNTGLLLLAILILTMFGVFPLTIETVSVPAVQGIIEIAIVLIISRAVKGDAWWLKYLMLTGIIAIYARLDMMLTHKAWILMVLPVVFSSRYFSRKLTVYTAVLSIIAFLISAYLGATAGMIDLNIVTMEKGTQMTATGGFLGDTVKNAGVSPEMLRRNTLLYNFLPKWMIFMIAAVISANIARTGREMVIRQHEKDVSAQAIKTELDLATRIQAGTLPNIFPPFPDIKSIDLYASMKPAKAVGGDFYDFYRIDDDHLALVIADVSGKGIPAALFMMVSKLLIQNLALSGIRPSEVLQRANETICRHNEEEMFITLWLGILDLKTGKVIAANAGHEYPILKEPNKDFEVFKDKHGFVVGGMDGMKYQDYEFTMRKGAKLFLYTDGLPEAANEDDGLFGIERTLEALNEIKDGSCEAILRHIDLRVKEFTGNAEQFDDLTMLALQYKG
ncbi:MAG: serine/threonine-protein phosphatase [Erysipelotrichaceae bacterium]|nr:serine/threonine-protein phosphatase [Erysipelotrichaceae bacterium]